MITELIENCRRHPNGRRVFTSEQKSTIVMEWEKSGQSAPDFCRQHGLSATQLYRWRKDSMRGATMGIKNQGDIYSKAELDVLRKENDELKKLVAEKELDCRILKKKLELDAQKLARKKST